MLAKTVRQLRGLHRHPITGLLPLLCLGLAAASTVTVEGVGHSRTSATANALRNAVEQSAGLYVSAETLVENHILMRDKILTRSDGYVRTYVVTATSEEFGLVRVVLDVEIADGKLRDDLIAQQLLYETKNRPRIMVLLDERIEGEEMFEKTASHVLEEELLERGFKIVEPEQLRELEQMRQAKALADGKLASLGFRTGADLIVRGRIHVGKCTPKMIYGAQFFTTPVQLNARIVRADNAQLLVSKTARTKKNSREKFSAAQFGLEAGARTLAGELIDALNEFWRSDAYNQNGISLMVLGQADKRLQRTEVAIRALPFVRDLALRYLEDTSAVYDLRMTGTVQDLRFAIAGNMELGLSVTALSPNRLTAVANAPEPEITFDPEPPALEITAFTIEDVFPSRAGYYERHPLGHVTIRCNRGPITGLGLSVHIPECMDGPAETRLESIDVGTERVLDLNILPARENLLASTDSRTVSGRVRVTYTGAAGEVSRTLTAPARVHGRNAMDWAEPQALAGFVSHDAGPILSLARRAVRAAPATNTLGDGILKAASLFALLDVIDIRYVRDPALSDATAIDKVLFPTETIELRGGDCDDLSVLYAALLTAVGVPAAVISYTDHVLVMFDTGIYRKNRASLSLDTSLSVVHRGTVWLPIETTLIDKGFVEAWHVAAREFHTAVAEGQRVSIIDLHSAWQRYPPVGYHRQVGDIEAPGLTEQVAKQVAAIEADAAAHIAAASKRVSRALDADKNKPVLMTRLGILAARKGDYAQALELFGKARKRTTAPAAASNYAAALLLTGREDEACETFDEVYRKDPSGRVAVNRALCYYATAHDATTVDRFVEALREAVDMMPSSDHLSEYLGIDLGRQTGVRATDGHDAEKPHTVNIRRLKQLIRRRVLTNHPDTAAVQDRGPAGGRRGPDVSGTTSETSTGESAEDSRHILTPFGGIRAADPAQVEKIRDLLYWIDIDEDSR